MVFPCGEEGSPPHPPDKDCNLKQRMSFCVPLSPSSSLSLCLSLCVCGNSDTAPSTEEGSLFFCALGNCKWETPRSSIHDPKVGACEVLLPEQGPAQEEGQPEGESLHKTHPFRLPVPLSSRGLKASIFYTDLINPHNVPLWSRWWIYSTQTQVTSFFASDNCEVRVLHF